MSEEQTFPECGDRRKNPAYRDGWEDGRFGPTRSFRENPSLTGWVSHQERLSYYRGHRDGRRVREMQTPGNSAWYGATVLL